MQQCKLIDLNDLKTTPKYLIRELDWLRWENFLPSNLTKIIG